MAHAAQLAVLVVLQSALGAPSTCPAREAVEAALLPSTANALRANREHIVLSASETTLRVQLAGESGAPILERSLATAASCAARVAAAATLVEAMELELHGGPPRVELPAMAAETAAPAREPGMEPELELGIAFLGSLSQATIEPAAGLTVDFATPWAGLRLRAALFAEGRRSLAIGTGSVSYQSSWLAIGPGYRLGWQRFSIEAGISLTGALQQLRGDGVTSVAAATALEAGAGLDAAAAWSFGSWKVWGGFFVLYWPTDTNLVVAALGESRPLPSWEGLLGAGLQFRSF